MNRLIKFRAWDLHLNKYILDTDLIGRVVFNDPTYTYQQFIGLLDKNGKEIYEGDFVRFSFYHGEHDIENTVGEVFFKEGIFYFDREGLFATNDSNFREESLEVVGNIFESIPLVP